MNQGFLIRGVCAGFKSTSRGQYTDNRVGIIFEKQDEFGNPSNVTQAVEVYGDMVNSLQQQANSFKGKHVEMKVYFRAMGGKNGPWIKYFAGRDSQLSEVAKTPLKQVSGQN
jgi:hypothetical protein